MLLAAVQDTSRMNSPIMPWQLHLFFFLFGSLLCLVGSSLYKSGVQHNVPMSSFAAAGCVPCHESPYGSTLNSEDIKSCGGPYLFVGVQKEDRSALEFGALVSVEVLRMDASKSAPYLSNGVYWHFTKGCSFGFEAVEHNLNVKDEESSRSLVSTNRGVSWRIDQSIDCTSLDDFTIQTLIDTSKWRKQIFNCPGTLMWSYNLFLYAPCAIRITMLKMDCHAYI